MTLAILLAGLLPTAQAGAQSYWTAPQWIPGLVDTDPSQYPIFITDPTGKVHVIHSQWVNSRYSIVYSQWTVGVGWSQPVDIYRPGEAQARVRAAFLDDNGVLNVVFWSGNEMGADIFFIQAPIKDAGRASAWTRPLTIGTNALSPTNAGAVTDGKGNIAVLYSSDEGGSGLYFVQSSDSGSTWTPPAAVFFTQSDVLWATDLGMAKGKDGSVHAVWSLADTTGNSRRIYYAKLTAPWSKWSNPMVLADAIGFEADTAAIIEHDGALFVIYHNDFPTTRFMIRSFDGGKTWTSPTRLFEHEGSNGAAALAEDSSGKLHMFFGNRIGNPAIHGLWHSIWSGGSWSVPEAVTSGPQVVIGPNGEEGFDPSYAQAVMVQGNLALVVWRHDPMAGPQHIWYSYLTLNAPLLPTGTLPSPKVTASPTPRPTAGPRVTPTAMPTFAGEIPEEMKGDTLNITLLAGIAPAVLLILSLVFIKRRKH